MKLKNKNVKIIIGGILGIILTSCISVYATYNYFATDVIYKKSGTEISVKQALDELYQNKKETTDTEIEITTNGTQTLDKYYKNLNVNVNPNFVTLFNNSVEGHGNNIKIVTLSKDYSKVWVFVNGLGKQTGTEAANASISWSKGTPQELYSYTSAYAYDSTNRCCAASKIQCMDNAKSGTEITVNVNYRGIAYVFAME